MPAVEFHCARLVGCRRRRPYARHHGALLSSLLPSPHEARRRRRLAARTPGITEQANSLPSPYEARRRRRPVRPASLRSLAIGPLRCLSPYMTTEACAFGGSKNRPAGDVSLRFGCPSAQFAAADFDLHTLDLNLPRCREVDAPWTMEDGPWTWNSKIRPEKDTNQWMAGEKQIIYHSRGDKSTNQM